jgi:hypothetical protein
MHITSDAPAITTEWSHTGEDYEDSEILWGKVAYMGKQALPCALRVRFQNGQIEQMTEINTYFE